MKKIENHWCDCDVPGYHCLGSACPLTRVEVYYCDECGEEIEDDIYDVEGKELCEYCLKDMFRRDE